MLLDRPTDCGALATLPLWLEVQRMSLVIDPAGSIAEILSSITNQYNGNGLQQGAGLVITGMLEAELKNNPVLLWMNGDVNYARSASESGFFTERLYCVMTCTVSTQFGAFQSSIRKGMHDGNFMLRSLPQYRVCQRLSLSQAVRQSC